MTGFIDLVAAIMIFSAIFLIIYAVLGQGISLFLCLSVIIVLIFKHWLDGADKREALEVELNEKERQDRMTRNVNESHEIMASAERKRNEITARLIEQRRQIVEKNTR